ncbi:MAG: hypothetical protein OEX02_17535, partial [Cyclobacteriaceae bacterium]|nr:hypothetical protein [Cyclobacteriaceae bacterium]
MKRHTLYVIWILLLSATFALAAQPQANGGFYDTAIAEGDTLADRKPILHHVFWNVNYYDLWVEGRKEVRDYYENFQVKLLDARQLEGQSGPSALMYYDGQNNLLHTISPGQLRNLESDRISQILVNAAIFAERKNKGGGYKQILSEDSLRSALVLLADISPAEMTGALRVFTESVRPVEQLAPQTLEVLFTHYTDYNDPFYAGLVGQFLRLEKLPEEQEIIAKYRDVVSAGAATANREVLPVAAEILGLLDVRAGRPFQPQKNADLADILYRYFSGDCGERELAAYDFAAKWLIKYSYAWQLEADSVYSKKTISKISRLAIKAGYGLGIANEHLAAQTDQVSWLVKSLKGRKHLLFGYKDSLLHKKPYRKLKQDFKSQFEEELESDMPARMADAPPNKQQIYINQQMKSFRRFLRKKKGGSKYNDIDFNLGPFGGFGDLNDHWLLMGTKRKGYIRLTFTPGQYSITELLPIVEQEEECGPFDFVMDNGNLMKSSLAPFRYRPYMPSSRTGQVIEREVRFEKDKASLDALYLKDIVAVMKDQDFTVLGVEVRAFASVEGDSLRNVGLFHRRANAVLNYLRRYNDEDIALDTLIVNEQWEMFANQLKNSDYARLGLLSRDSLRAWLAISENAQSVEHLLAPQRKAILKIRLARRLSHREKMDKVLEGVYKTAEMMDREKTESRLFELGRLYMGMLHYIQNTVTDGRLAQSDADALFNDLARTHTWHNYFAYYLAVTNMERGMSGASVADIETLTLRAFTDCRAGLPNRFYMKAVEDIQARTIEMIQTGQISPCVLDGFAYPM